MSAGIPARPEPYVMREATEKDRLPIEVMLRKRSAWATARNLPASATVPFVLEMIGRTTPDGARLMVLTEDAHLLGCVVVTRRAPVTDGWSGPEMAEPALYLTAACTRHDTPDPRGRLSSLMTLWTRDHAARLGLPQLRCSVRAPQVADLLVASGWKKLREGENAVLTPVSLLWLTAQSQPGLHRFIADADTAAPEDGLHNADHLVP
ncbi:hypothetical protein AB0P17_24500 [Streptomyces sp. NPDC088124]|uniref:hypothetical protein n=1 Tax=Streptomyces sp. NPDC088124 TaxID=3154654 RepID=UPI0034250156